MLTNNEVRINDCTSSIDSSNIFHRLLAGVCFGMFIHNIFTDWGMGMRTLADLLTKLHDNNIPYTRKDYGRFITIDVANRSYDFRIGGKLIGIYSTEVSHV